jgi:hypothetical protein
MLTEAQFIACGMTKDKWPHVTSERIQSMLDDPSKLDDQVGWEKFTESFYYYFDWYWRENGERKN